MRASLLFLFVFGALGTGTELLLLGHTGGVWQRLPVVLLGAGVLAAGLHGVLRRRATVRLLAALSLIFVLSGFAGFYLHYRNNAEFEREMYPDRRGAELFREAMSGALPALAPGAMIQLGLIGLLWSWRHPQGKEDR